MTEITLDFDLLWRNNVPPQKVVMGLAFYGRGFTVFSTSCTEPGCTFSSGSLPGNCSQTSSMLMNSEIKNIMALRGIESSLDQDAEVKILTWDDQWTTYDGASSFKLKTDFARSECLGGVMVWAVSHDDSSGTFSRSLSDTTIRPFTSLAGYHSDGGPSANIIVYEQHPQSEHVIELQVIPQFFQTITAGNLVSGSPIHYNPVPFEFFATAGQIPGSLGAINLPFLANVRASPIGQSTAQSPAERVMYPLGATKNAADFYLLRSKFNGVKASIFKNSENIVDNMDIYTADLTNPSIALKGLRDVIAVWAYLNDPPVTQSVVNVANNVRAQLAITAQRWPLQPSGFPIDLVNAWDEWFPDMLIHQAERSSLWIEDQITAMRRSWQGQTGNTKAFADGALYSLEVQRLRYVSAFAITLSL
ncbi:hypothetical protein TCE0_038r12439 [Talaromyces pinophilus]|uniref:chitinase n=1 Tax=Talaromyces pinophilus TaxID=128442 RepID=A0A0B8N150_TALPI|nr:hypothetical protein TCE0_038r12439 [Talaromyces pinophilus]